MRLGILHNSLAANNLQEAFSRASAASAEGVEVMYARAEQAALLADAGHLQELKAMAAKHALAVPSFCLGFLCEKSSLIGQPKLIARSQEFVLQAMDAAAAAGAGVVLVPFFGKNAIETEDELSRASDALLELVEHAEAAGVVLAVESTLNFDQHETLLHYLGDSANVKVYYDTGNLLARKLDVPTGIRQLGRERIAQVHVKDVRIAEGAQPDFNVTLGEGSLDLRACVEALRAIGYDGWLILETPPGDDGLASARANLAYLRNLLAH